MTTRLFPLLATVAFAAVIGSLVVGASALAVTFLVPTIAVGVMAQRTLRRDPVEHPWTAPGDVAAAGGRSIPEGPARRPPASRVARGLALVEARELVLSPWFGVGFGFCVVMVVAFAPTYDGHESWGDVVQDLPFLAHPFVGMIVVASHRAATRDGRDGTGELTASSPTTGRTRAASALAAAWVPVVALATFCVAYLAVVDQFSTGVSGPLSTAAVVTGLVCLMLGAGGVALGLALGRWAQSPLAPIVALVAIGFAAVRLASGKPGELSARMLLSTMAPLAEPGPVLTTGHAFAQLGWITIVTVAVGLVVVVGRHERSSPPPRP